MPRFAILLLLATTAIAQNPAQPATDAVAFEVAAIKPNNTASGNSQSNSHDGVFTATNVTLKRLMQYEAYDIPPSRILGGPKWLDSARFDIRAKVDEATEQRLHKLGNAERRDANMAIFQQLLADRFHLQVHWETRELPVYALVPTKSGAKITPRPELPTATSPSPGIHPAKDPARGVGRSTHEHSSSVDFEATSVTLAQLAQALTSSAQQDLGRAVLDQTNIAGTFDVVLNWTRELDHPSPSSDANASDPGPTLFTAIQEQLGLKLESTKGPVQVLVIDQASLPTEN